MQLSEKELAFLVERIAREVKKLIGKPKDNSETAYGTVALFADIVPSPKKALEHIKTKYGLDTELYLLNGVRLRTSEFSVQTVENDEDRTALMQRLALAKRILLISPSIGTLTKIEDGNDNNFSELCMIRAMLWEKDVNIVLDFEPPKFKRGTLFEKVTSIIDSLTCVGVKMDVYKPAKSGNEGKLLLVTENEIIEARKNGNKTVVCEKGAIVTPLAVDTAKELKIHIERE